MASKVHIFGKRLPDLQVYVCPNQKPQVHLEKDLVAGHI
jgi:hypothetical protein